MGLIVHIGGYPGVGKHTVGGVLAAAIGAKFLDNHLMLNPATALFGRKTPGELALRRRIRDACFDAIRTLPADVRIVLTDALGVDAEGRHLWAEVERLAADRGDRLVPVILDCAPAENALRLTHPGRAAQRKLTDTGRLAALRQAGVLLVPEGAFRLDVTDLAPDAAAARLCAALGLPAA